MRERRQELSTSYRSSHQSPLLLRFEREPRIRSQLLPGRGNPNLVGAEARPVARHPHRAARRIIDQHVRRIGVRIAVVARAIEPVWQRQDTAVAVEVVMMMPVVMMPVGPVTTVTVAPARDDRRWNGEDGHRGGERHEGRQTALRGVVLPLRRSSEA